MEDNKKEDKEIQDIIDDITSTAKDLVNEYVSGKDNFVPEEERTEVNEKLIKAPYKDTDEDIPFKVTDEEMEHLFEVEAQIKEVFREEPDIYIVGGEDDQAKERVEILEFCKQVTPEKFSILDFIGVDKDKLKRCLKIKKNDLKK
tara:strand:- start:334 stop:768 length:435 start_codon:yes stop_codon:yes gene_type:complete